MLSKKKINVLNDEIIKYHNMNYKQIIKEDIISY